MASTAIWRRDLPASMPSSTRSSIVRSASWHEREGEVRNDNCTPYFISAHFEREQVARKEQYHRLRRRPVGILKNTSSPVWDRLSHARQRRRGRGRRTRRLVTVADRRSQRGSRRRGIPRDDGNSIGDQRRPVGTLTPRDTRRTLAAGARRHERGPR